MSQPDRPSEPIATAPMEAARALLHRWQEAFNSREIARIVALYAPDATLLGTSKAQLQVGREQIHSYFSGTSTVRLDDLVLHQLSAAAVLGVGFYTFRRRHGERDEMVAARFSFVVVRRGDDWLILHHHSSALPA